MERKPFLLSDIYTNKKFYWDNHMMFYGIFVGKVENSNLIEVINSGADGNSEQYEAREDCIVWIDKEDDYGTND